MRVNNFKPDRKYVFSYEEFVKHFGEDKDLEKVDGVEVQVIGRFAGRILYHNSKVNTDVYRFINPGLTKCIGKVRL